MSRVYFDVEKDGFKVSISSATNCYKRGKS